MGTLGPFCVRRRVRVALPPMARPVLPRGSPVNWPGTRRHHAIILVASATLFAAVTIAMVLLVLLPRWDIVTMRGPAENPFLQFEVADMRDQADLIIIADVTKTGGPELIEIDSAARARLRAKGMTSAEIARVARQEAGKLYTVSRVRQATVLKGSASREVTVVRVPASGSGLGRTDDDRYLVPGERVVLFLEAAFDGVWEPVGIYVIEGETARLRGPGPTSRVSLEELLHAIDAQ